MRPCMRETISIFPSHLVPVYRWRANSLVSAIDGSKRVHRGTTWPLLVSFVSLPRSETRYRSTASAVYKLPHAMRPSRPHGRFDVVLRANDVDLVWNCTYGGPTSVTVMPPSCTRDDVVALRDIVNAAMGATSFRAVKYPNRCVVLCVLSYSRASGVATIGSIAMTALALCFNPLELLLIVRGHAVDSWTKSFWEQWDQCALGTLRRHQLDEDALGLELIFAHEPSSNLPHTFGGLA